MVNNRNSAAFTLIELSIVLVIIGLIVGGVLVGKDLLYAARIRATASQYTQYKTAVQTFRLKYNALAGDLTSSQAAQFGLTPTSRPSTLGPSELHGDGILQGGGPNKMGGELLLFWQDLSSAGLISESFTQAVDNVNTFSLPTTNITISNRKLLEKFFPLAKVGEDALFIAHSTFAGINEYYFGSIGSTSLSADIAAATSFTPFQAYDLDIKIDDGVPNSGIVKAGTSTGLEPGYTDPNFVYCALNTSTPWSYNFWWSPQNKNCNLHLSF